MSKFFAIIVEYFIIKIVINVYLVAENNWNDYIGELKWFISLDGRNKRVECIALKISPHPSALIIVRVRRDLPLTGSVPEVGSSSFCNRKKRCSIRVISCHSGGMNDIPWWVVSSRVENCREMRRGSMDLRRVARQ